MKDDSFLENVGENGDLNESATAERRPSIETLRSMLKKVSQSPFHNQQQMLDTSASANGDQQDRFSHMSGLRSRDNPRPTSQQNGVHKPSTNPFYSYYLESTNHSEDNSTERVNSASAFVSPPEFQSSPMDTNIFQKTESSSKSHDAPLFSPDLFGANQSLRNGSKTAMEDFFVESRTEEVNPSIKTDNFLPPKPSTNPFHSSNYDKENQSPALVQSKHVTVTNSNEELDIFSPLTGSSSLDPFPSPVTRNIDFSSIEDPFGDSPLRFSDPFQDASLDTSDVFSSPKVPAVKARPPRPRPPVSSPKDSTVSADKPTEIVLTTPQGSQHSVMQPTPLVQAGSLCASPSHTPKLTHVSTFRRPPKPLPRIRRSRTLSSPKAPTPPEKPAKPQRPSPPSLASTNVPEAVASPEPLKIPPKPPTPKLSPKPSFNLLQKPLIRRKQKDNDRAANPENYVVYEDILLIGQEQCVEDWPEDSPEVQPNFKPRGTLRLRRESLMAKTDFETEDLEGSGSSKKKKEKHRMSLTPRRDSKERFSDECTGRSRTHSASRKSSREYYTDSPYSSQEFKKDEKEDPDQSLDYRKPHFKNKVSSFMRRSSAEASFSDQKRTNGNVPHESKDLDLKKSKKDPLRRFSEGATLDGNSGESGDDVEYKKTRKLKSLKFTNKGLVFHKDEQKGAHGFTPTKGSKEDLFAHTNYSTQNKSQDDGLEKQMKSQSLQSSNKAAYMDDDFAEKSPTGGYEAWETEKLKGKSSKHKPLLLPRKNKLDHSSPEQMGQFRSSQQDLNGEFEYEDIDALKAKQKEMYHTEEDDVSEPKKTFKLKSKLKSKLKGKSPKMQNKDPPGAASADYMSEAAKAELMAAEKDRLTMEAYEDGDEDWDTDSLMEWWNTVEQWDEVPSDEEETALQQDESKSFSGLADKVDRGLRLFNKVFVERAEVLWQSVITLHTIADDISTFHSKARIAGITGGTTTAIGGVAAIAGLALAPVTLGVSLVITAVGVGVATAGGITTASAAISDNVNNSNDRKKVEAVLLENEVHLVELSKILHFSNTGLYKLRGHPFLRSGTQHYSQDWEVRRAVQMISLVDSPVMKATDLIDSAVSAVKGLFQGMDKYFVKEGSRDLKKGCKKEIVAQIKDVANILNDCIIELNAVRGELQEALGEV
ncbi:unnamed protein product [Knipowitschia caucasica]|uniref:Uncharacterized protein n=1 Tax=Knipowitschia caucasica TaxID=637954 RepID=A0AAV2KUV0_KNICA